MKVVNTGKTYRIYGSDLKVHDELPVGAYIVRFNKMQGFYLDEYSGVEVNESKIYGVHMSKIKKVMKTFDQFTRNLGIILSGDKGIGKSLFARILCQNSMDAGYPVIVVEDYIPGIHSFLEEIEQEVVVLFDEFDKTFPSDNDDSGKSPQASLLSLLDGVSSGKKLYVVTCNKFHSLNEYLINRPGRFHYHFRFNYPTSEEVKTYLQDKIDAKYWGEIPKAISFAGKVNLNYDCLRAIAYELQNGESFEEAIDDLNIMNLSDQSYDIVLHFEDGSSTVRSGYKLDLFSVKKEHIWMQNVGPMDVSVEFIPSKAKYSTKEMCSIVDSANFKVDFSSDDSKDGFENPVPSYLTIAQTVKNNYKYAF